MIEVGPDHEEQGRGEREDSKEEGGLGGMG